MAMKRKYSSKKRSYKKKRFVRRKTAARAKRFAKAVKRVVMKTAEPKCAHYPMAASTLYHDTIFYYRLNDSGVMPSRGVSDTQRVGDQINLTGFRVRAQITQIPDRPNLSYRWWFVEVPKGTAYSYGNWFDPTTNNTQLDDVNKDLVKVIKSGHWRPNQASLATAGVRGYGFTKRLWCPRKKIVKFGPADGATTHNDNDVYLMIAPYDAYQSLTTDAVCTFQGALDVFYRDP